MGRTPRCHARATDRETGRVVHCQERKDHQGPHHWKLIQGNQLLSATWYGHDVTIGPNETTYNPNEEAT